MHAFMHIARMCMCGIVAQFERTSSRLCVPSGTDGVMLLLLLLNSGKLGNLLERVITVVVRARFIVAGKRSYDSVRRVRN